MNRISRNLRGMRQCPVASDLSAVQHPGKGLCTAQKSRKVFPMKNAKKIERRADVISHCQTHCPCLSTTPQLHGESWQTRKGAKLQKMLNKMVENMPKSGRRFPGTSTCNTRIVNEHEEYCVCSVQFTSKSGTVERAGTDTRESDSSISEHNARFSIQLG